jgi:hypothetical protein
MDLMLQNCKKISNKNFARHDQVEFVEKENYFIWATVVD